MTRTAVVTIVAGRHHHLRAQQRSLAAGSRRPDLVVVVSMGDERVRAVVDDGPFDSRTTAGAVVVELDVTDPGDLPLSRARNLGAATALERGADLLVFLDVDCLAGPDLTASYAEAAGRTGDGEGPVVLGGPVAYLPPLSPGRTSYDPATLARTSPHPARPAPGPGELERAPDTRLFWSLSFAVTAPDWRRLGGFDEDYTGYGGEDTDFGQRLASADGTLWWVGGARAFHQWHPVSAPPVEHLEQIVRNANRFHDRWGWFPMEGWLDAFQDAGLARHDPTVDVWRVASRR